MSDHGTKENAPAEPELRLTDAGNGERFAEMFGDRCKFDIAEKRWRIYDGSRWREAAPGEMGRHAVEAARAFHRDAIDFVGDRKAAIEWALASEMNRGVRATLEAAISVEGMTIAPDQWDNDPMLLSVGNGVLDLRTGKLLKRQADRFISRHTPVIYNSEAKAPAWERFLDQTFAGDTDLIDYVQRFHGHALTGDITEHLLHIYHGGGSNGKSTFIEAIVHAMGEYADISASGLLVERKGPDGHPTELADLRGKRLVFTSETKNQQQLRLQLVKQLTGDEMIKARPLHRDFFTFRRTAKLVLLTNNRPRIDEPSVAAWRRMRLVPFSNEVPDIEKDTGLKEKFEQEAPGILRWLVDGCRKHQERDLRHIPMAIAKATAAYRRSDDPIGEFVAQRCRLHADAWVASADLREAIEEIGVDEHRLWKALRDRYGCRNKRKKVDAVQIRIWEGIELKPKAHLIDVLDELREPGKGWDAIDDPDAFLKEMTGER